MSKRWWSLRCNVRGRTSGSTTPESRTVSKVDLLDETFDRFGKVMAVDLLGPMLGTRYAGRVMQRQGAGVIINGVDRWVYAGYGMPVYRAPAPA
jgi:NAD(P)-dependent dehydrogenase (short-subunit alcohol dehydrogenase family)